jgi:plastocyanin
VAVTNRGRLGHAFRIRGKNRNVLSITTIEPGETKSRSRRLARGTYTMYCVLANHEELGMYGTLVVG